MLRLFRCLNLLAGGLVAGFLLLLLTRWYRARKQAHRFAIAPDAPYLLPLGGGRAKQHGVGPKAALLDRAIQAGLPVPPGLILLDEGWQYVQAQGLVQRAGESVSVPDPARLLAALGLIPDLFAGPIAVRSAFAAEDQHAKSLAGYFTSRLFVDPTDPAALASALAEVWTSALKRPGPFRCDVLLMTMVHAQHAGVAFTEQGYEDDLVNYTSGTAERLVGGQDAGETVTLPRLLPLDWPAPTPATDQPFALRLQNLLGKTRRVFGLRDWDIEWADDGRQCWLVQIRPVTRLPRRNEAFTTANFKEIMPDPPSPFMTSHIAACADGLFAAYRRFDKQLPTHRPFIEVFYGRPFFNISLLTDMMRLWGLPTQLVTNNIGGVAERDFGLNIGRFLHKTPVLLRLGWAQAGSVGAAQRTMTLLEERTRHPGDTFRQCLDTFAWLFIRLVTEMLSLVAAMSGPLLVLRHLGVLTEHNARQQNIATAIDADLDPLRQLVHEHPTLREALTARQVPDAAEFQRLWQAYLNKHGHRGVYESDIARPRFHEMPEPLLASLTQPVRARTKPPRTWRGWLTMPLWWQAGRVIRAREMLRYTALIGFDRVRQRLLSLADEAVASGQLPNRDALWQLTVSEVGQLDDGWRPAADFFARRAADSARYHTYDLPDLLRRFDDPAQFTAPTTNSESPPRWRGISLTDGTVTGRAWVLTEPQTELPSGFTPDETILVARSIDAGWIPTFGQVVGVVVEIGGDLSHGSIILREMGLPAITNVSHILRHLNTGDPVTLHAGAGLIERTATSGA